MKSFKLLTFVAGLLAVAALAGCQQKVEDPYIRIDGETTLNLSKDKTSVKIKVESNRDWGMRFVDKTGDWIVAEPARGTASKNPTEVTITVTENTGANRTAAIEFYTGVATAMLTIVQAGPDGDSDGVQAVTIQDFITRADKTTYYRLTGTVSSFQTGTNSSGKDWMQFNLTDDTGSILVYGFANGQYEAWSGKIKNGGTLTLQGQYEYYSQKSQHEVVNATIESFTPGEEQTEITATTVADFIAKASGTIYYRLTGTVSSFQKGTNSSGKNWMQFNLADNTGTILVYGFATGQYEEWASKIKDNGTVVLVGTYEYYSAKNQHEVMNATIESFTEGAAPQAVTGTVAETCAAQDGASVVISQATVMAKSKAGLVVADESGAVYVFFKSSNGETVPDVAIGDKVKVEATKSTYGGVPEFTSPTVTKVSAGTASYPEPKDLNPIATGYASAVTEFVKMTGTLKVSGNYVNIEINGVDPATKQGSVSQPLDALGVNAFDGKEVTVTGYFTGMTKSKEVSYINIVATSIAPADPDAKYCNVNPTAINAKADATSATFTIAANAAWTVTSDNDAFTVAPASGDADATVTVTFSANEGDSPRVANLRVVCAAAGVETTVVLTQARASSGEATVISIDFTSEISALPQAKANGKIDGTYTLGGYEFIMHAEGKYNGEDNKFYQAVSSGKYYLLIGRQNAYIQLPVIEGKALTKVEFLTGASASNSVIVDVAKADGTRLNVNTAAMPQGTKFEWEINGEVGQAYKLLVTTNHNAQFQNLTLTYE
ncbi:MAG: hypothetical protein IKX71_07355 [Bacteroidales bacterium]|nr:hypothetical protein [Bacteroidales bacterium]